MSDVTPEWNNETEVHYILTITLVTVCLFVLKHNSNKTVHRMGLYFHKRLDFLKAQSPSKILMWIQIFFFRFFYGFFS